MIKIGKYLYIHYTFLFLIAVCYFNRNLELLFINYSVIFLHELAHLVAAISIGLLPSRITLFAFGVNLKLKNTFIYTLTDEILLYLSGSLLNGILALILVPFYQKNEYLSLFYYSNISLFLFNLLPILPMDGAVVLKKILTGGVGYRPGECILKIISVILIIVIFVAEMFLIIKGSFNFTFLFAMIFLTANIFTNKEKYHIDFVKELIYINRKDKKEIKNVKAILIKDGASYKNVAKKFSRLSNYIILRENQNGEIYDIVTEKYIIDKILK